MLKLEEIIDAAEGREIKRAIAVKMVLLGFKTRLNLDSRLLRTAHPTGDQGLH